MAVPDEEQWNFCYVLPDPPGSPVRIVVPSALQMGWMESPAHFACATETGRDIIQTLVNDGVELPPHTKEHYMAPERPPKRRKTGPNDFSSLNVYIDDYCLGVVESPDGTLLKRVSRAALHTIHAMFPPPEALGHIGGKDSISQRKLEKGDARWDVEKEILGFLLNGRDRTIRLPQAKADAIAKELNTTLRRRRVPLKRFQKIVGKLRHAATILPAAKGLFTPINNALKGNVPWIGLGKGSDVRRNLRDLGQLVASLALRPTHVAEIVESSPEFVGHCDACATGAGGVWFSEHLSQPLVWRVHFPPVISEDVVSDNNPDGSITNSDLELAGVLLHQFALQSVVDVHHTQTGMFCDNTPSVAWVDRMASRSQAPIAGRLLRGLAMRQRALHAAPTSIASIAGTDNKLADVASRAFFSNPVPMLDDNNFLTFFSTEFPLPQMQSWQVVHPTPELTSLVLSTLQGKIFSMRQWTTKAGRGIGNPGWNTAGTAASTRTSRTSPNRPSNQHSLPLLSGSGKATSEKELRSKLARSKRGLDMSPSRQCWLDIPTHDAPTEPRN